MKHAIEMALQNSKDIQMARIQASLAERASMVTKAEFYRMCMRDQDWVTVMEFPRRQAGARRRYLA
jgi:hypothetical protein